MKFFPEMTERIFGVESANIDNAFPSVRARFKSLRLASCVPTGRCNRTQHRIKIIYRKRNVDRSDIARFEINTFSVRWRVVLEQFNFVSVTLENGDRNLSAGHSGDFAGELTCMMGTMRKFEAENILPERDRP